MRLGQQALELTVLKFKLAQSFGLAGVHAGVLCALLVKGSIAKAMLTSYILDWDSGLG